MLISTISHVICAWFAFLLPCFSTFKALSHRPLSEQELERWSMYWTVLGIFLAFEYVTEWLVSWLPFYWELKTIFMLFLALPQTQGSTFIYRTYLQPFLIQNEANLDASIISVQRNAFSFLQTQISKAWAMILELSKRVPASRTPASGTSPSTTGAAQPTAISLPLPLASAMNLWNQYGQSVMSLIPALTPTTSQPPPVSASSTSLPPNDTTSAQYRAPFSSNSPGDPNPSIPFPEAQHF